MTGDIWKSNGKTWYSDKLINKIVNKCKLYCIDMENDTYTEGWMGKRELAKEIMKILGEK